MECNVSILSPIRELVITIKATNSSVQVVTVVSSVDTNVITVSSIAWSTVMYHNNNVVISTKYYILYNRASNTLFFYTVFYTVE